MLIGALAVLGAFGVGAIARTRLKGRRLLDGLAAACADQLAASRALRESDNALRELDAELAARQRALHVRAWWAQTASLTTAVISPVAAGPLTLDARDREGDPRIATLTTARAVASRRVTDGEIALRTAGAARLRLATQARARGINVPACADPYDAHTRTEAF